MGSLKTGKGTNVSLLVMINRSNNDEEFLIIVIITMIMIAVRKEKNGVSTNGVTAIFVFFDRGTFWVLPLAYFYLPKSVRAYLFPQSVKIHYF